MKNYDEVRRQYNLNVERFTTPEEMVGASPENIRLPKYLLEYVSKRNAFLDAGCGTAVYFGILKDHFKELYGIDVADQLIEIARSNHPYAKFFVGNISKLDMFEDKKFNLIWCRGVLMYLDDKDLLNTMFEFQRILSDEGAIVLEYYNRPSLNDFYEKLTGVDWSIRRPVNSKQVVSLCRRLNLDVKIVNFWGIFYCEPLIRMTQKYRFARYFKKVTDKIYRTAALKLFPFLKFYAGYISIVIRKKVR